MRYKRDTITDVNISLFVYTREGLMAPIWTGGSLWGCENTGRGWMGVEEGIGDAHIYLEEYVGIERERYLGRRRRKEEEIVES